ncbi:MAG: MBL fold metallo-hydrolase [Leptospirales bacterium]|nr:MBL fold metallo-hydrolase [Leptospirales bacterium]
MKFLKDERVKEIAANIYLLAAPKKGQFPYCHGFLFVGDRNIIIDSGMDEDLITSIDREIGIDTLIISHSHPDHIRCWNILSHRELLLPMEMPDSVHNLESLGERFVGSRERGVYWADVIGNLLKLQPLRQPDRRYSNGDIFDIGSARIEAIHNPGHLDDHYCFFEHLTGTLITIDIDFTSFGPWYGNPEGRIKPFKAGIKEIMKMPYKRVCSSHKLPHEGDAAPLFNDFLAAFDRQKEVIYSAVGAGKTLHEITQSSPIYNNKFLDPFIQYAFEENMAHENLLLLIEEGRIVKDGDLYIPVK